MGAHEKRAMPAIQQFTYDLFARDADIEEINPVVHEKHAIMDRRCECEDLPKNVGDPRFSPKRPPQIVSGCAPRGRGKAHEISGDAVEDHAGEPSSKTC